LVLALHKSELLPKISSARINSWFVITLRSRWHDNFATRYNEVHGLQVRKGDNWITVKPVKNAFIVNIGDQIQVNYTF
jgi:hypothetical protein